MPAVQTAYVRPGLEALRWVRQQIDKAQQDDRLAPVTVIVPSHYAGLWIRRELAAEQSYANIRFAILGQIAERLGAASLAEAGYGPLSSSILHALVREAIRQSGANFGTASEHPALHRRLASLFQELRLKEMAPSQLVQLAASGEVAHSALEVFNVTERLREQYRLYDDRDLRDAAVEQLGSRMALTALGEWGGFLLFLPHALSPSDIRLVEALAEYATLIAALPSFADGFLPGPSSLSKALSTPVPGPEPSEKPLVESIILATNPETEVRSVVASVLRDMEERHVPLYRIAILYRSEDQYRDLLREILDLAALPYVGLDRIPVRESKPARALLDLLKLEEQDFSRTAVLAWLTSSPHCSAGVSASRWDRISRDAAIVKGLDQWENQLERLARANDDKTAAETDPEDETNFPRIRARQREAEDARAMASHIRKVGEAIEEGSRQETWEGFVGWAQKLRRELIPDDKKWDQGEREAGALLDETLQAMRSLGRFEPRVNLERFVQTLDDALISRSRPEGRLGEGVVIGQIQQVLGMDFERVYVLGLTEGSFPTRLAVDPVFGGEDPLSRTQQRLDDEKFSYLMALSTARDGSVVLSLPLWEGRARVYPSTWLLDEVERFEGRRVSSLEMRELPVEGRSWLSRFATTFVALEGRLPFLNMAEGRTAEAFASEKGGLRLEKTVLGVRDDLPLRAHIAAQDGRRSNRLSEFDGNLSSLSGSDVLAAGIRDQTVSASQLQGWATCGFQYFMGRLVGVQATERPEFRREWTISALDRGALIHQVLKQFFSELRDAGRFQPGQRYEPADYKRLEALAEAAFVELEEQGTLGNRLAWANAKQSIRHDLQTLLDKDQELRGANFIPSYFEQSFGYGKEDGWSALEVAIRHGSVTVGGYIDRVDRSDDGSVMRVIDYKTGKPEKDEVGPETRFRAGTRMQLPLYAAAARQAVPAASVEALYWFATARGEFQQKRLALDAEAERTLGEVLDIVDEGVRQGSFGQVPGEYDEFYATWENCGFCAFDRICPAGRDKVFERKSDDRLAQLHARLSPEGAT